MPTDEEPKLAGICPECGSAMSVRKSKKGKVYYSCIGYPDCKFMSWDVPTGEKCPQCGNGYLVKTARGNVKCSNKDCNYRVKTEQPQTKGKKAPNMAVGFEAPTLEEPFYDYDDAGYFPEDFEE